MHANGKTVPDPHVIVLFGALGDLSRRKLLPGLFHLEHAGLMPDDYRILGTSRRGGSADQFRDIAREAIGEEAAGDAWQRFAGRLCFDAFSAEDHGPLVEAVSAAERELGGEPRCLYYLAIPPAAFSATVRALGESGLAERARVVLEKPFGMDLETARHLNQLVHGWLPARSSRITVPTTSRSTSVTPAASLPAFWRRYLGRRCASGRRVWSSHTRARSARRALSPMSA